MLPSFMRQTIHVLDPVLVDDHGTDVADWSVAPASRIRVDRCLVEPLTAGEVLANRDASEAAWKVIAPTVDAQGRPYTVRPTSRVEFAGVAHDVVGHPGRQPSGSGALDHITIILSAWEG